MTIVEKAKVREAYVRARELGASHESACASVAQSLAIPVEYVGIALQLVEEQETTS